MFIPFIIMALIAITILTLVMILDHMSSKTINQLKRKINVLEEEVVTLKLQDRETAYEMSKIHKALIKIESATKIQNEEVRKRV